MLINLKQAKYVSKHILFVILDLYCHGMFVQYVNWVGISIQKFKDNQGTLNVTLLDLGAANDEKFEKKLFGHRL